jgi:cyclic pyranopterin phosphate synthase
MVRHRELWPIASPPTTITEPSPVFAELQPAGPPPKVRKPMRPKLKKAQSCRGAEGRISVPEPGPGHALIPVRPAPAGCGLWAPRKVPRLCRRRRGVPRAEPARQLMSGSSLTSSDHRFQPMVDPFGRTIRYLRVSVTDRCDLRCFYCMSEDMTFLPKKDLLTLEELDRLCSAFIAKGVRKIRLTGGEPLVRRNVMSLVRSLSRHLSSGALDELTLTTNASQLARFAGELRDCGVRRVNVSLDTLDAQKFRAITRWGDLDKVLAGIEAARDAGLAVKINAVALKNMNEEEIPSLMEWAHGKGMALTLIEVMPMGDIGEGRIDQYVPLSLLRARLAKHYTLTDLDEDTGGPARYVRVGETGGKLGFITPMTHNFCESCNRVRITCTGTLHTCLGHEDASDLRKPLRASADDDLLSAAIDRAIGLKPKGHDFIIDRRHNRPSVSRHMSVTGG